MQLTGKLLIMIAILSLVSGCGSIIGPKLRLFNKTGKQPEYEGREEYIPPVFVNTYINGGMLVYKKNWKYWYMLPLLVLDFPLGLFLDIILLPIDIYRELIKE